MILGLTMPALFGVIIGLRYLFPFSEAPVFSVAQTIFNSSTIPVFWLADRIFSAHGIGGDAAMGCIPLLMIAVAVYYALLGFGIGCGMGFVIGAIKRKQLRPNQHVEAIGGPRPPQPHA